MLCLYINVKRMNNSQQLLLIIKITEITKGNCNVNYGFTKKNMFVDIADENTDNTNCIRSYERPSISIALSATQFQSGEWIREPSEIMQIVRWIRK